MNTETEDKIFGLTNEIMNPISMLLTNIKINAFIVAMITTAEIDAAIVGTVIQKGPGNLIPKPENSGNNLKG